jgi:hypothetical protein
VGRLRWMSSTLRLLIGQIARCLGNCMVDHIRRLWECTDESLRGDVEEIPPTSNTAKIRQDLTPTWPPTNILTIRDILFTMIVQPHRSST